MKKLRKLILIISAVAALMTTVLFIASCSDDETPTTYTLTFVTNGGTEIAPIKAKAGETITPPDDPEKDGYTFGGWYLDGDFDGDAVVIPTVMPKANVTYYALFVEDGIKIKYEYNLGAVWHSADIAPSVGQTGDTVQVKDGAAFGANGYKFVGWSAYENGVVSLYGAKAEGQYYVGEDVVLGDYDITLYAQWAREYTDARGQSSDKIYVYTPLIDGGLGGAILVRAGYDDKLGFVSYDTGFIEFDFLFDEAEGGDRHGRIYSDFTYAYAVGEKSQYVYYDYITQSVGVFVLATDEYGFATLNEVVGSETALRAYGNFAYDEEYGDYMFVYIDERTGAECINYFTVEPATVEGTQFDGYFTFQGMESGSYLLYDNGELLNYRLDLNGYGSAVLYAYDLINDETEVVGSGTYRGTADYEDYYGEWEFVPSRDSQTDGFKFIVNAINAGSEIIPVYIEYNAAYDVSFRAAVGDGELYVDGYGGAEYVDGGIRYMGYCTIDGQVITFLPSLIDGQPAVNPVKMYFNVDFAAQTFTVNVDGFIINDGVLTAYRGTAVIVVVPDEVTEIGENAFNYTKSETDTSLVSVTIPASVTKIGAHAFENNYSLRRAVFLSETPAEIESWDSSVDPFRWPAGGFIIVVPEGSQAAYREAWKDCPYDIKGSVEVTELPEFEIIDNVLVRYNRQDESEELIDIVIPDGVIEIADNVFKGALYIASVDLNDVKTIGENAFYGCENLETVIFAEVETVGDGAFGGCVMLSSSGARGVLILPAVKTLGENAFQGCVSLERVILGEALEAIGDRAFCECQIFEDGPTLFVELLGDAAPEMGEKIMIGNIAVRIQVQSIEVAFECFNASSWSPYCKHLYIRSGKEAGSYICGADLLELDGRAEFQSSYLFLYEIDGTHITFYEYIAPGDFIPAAGTIENDVIRVAFGGKSYEFERITGDKTYTTADGKYTLVVNPYDLLPQTYDGYTGYATAVFNGDTVRIYISGFNTKRITGYLDSDGKRYDISLSFDGNTLVVSKKASDVFVRDIACDDGSVINLHYSGSLVYVFGELKIEVAPDTYLVWSDGGTLAQMLSDTEFTFTRDYRGTKYVIDVTLSDDLTTFTYTYTVQA